MLYVPLCARPGASSSASSSASSRVDSLAAALARPRRRAPRWARSLAVLVTSLAVLGSAACGKKASKPESDKAVDAGPPPAPPLPVPELGAEAVRRFNFLYGDGAASFAKASAAYKAKPRDWAGVRAGAEAALAKDSFHLEAHRLLAAALAQDGDYSGAAPHLLAAMAGDWTKYGTQLPSDADLATLFASPTGTKVKEAAAAIQETFAKKASAGLLLVGRRTTFKFPDKPGVQSATPRGELYAYDRDSKRFLRLSQTDHATAGFLRSPSGKELVLVGFDKLEMPGKAPPAPSGGAVTKPGDEPVPPEEGDPMPPEEGPGSAAPPPKRDAIKLARAFALVLDATTFEPLGKRVSLPKGKEIAVGYATGERLVAVSVASGRWDSGEDAPADAAPQWITLDPSTGKSAKTAPATVEVAVAISAEGGDSLAPLAGLRTSPESGATVDQLTTESGTAIAIPDAAAASRPSLTLSPDKTRLALATAPDPCNPDAAPSLYVIDTATGVPKHLLTGKSRFISRWLDASTLAYEDPDGGLRLWDLTSGREASRLADKGLALAFLATSPAPVCAAAVR